MKHERPPKKKLKKFEESFEEVPTEDELKKEENFFKRQFAKLHHMIRPKKVHVAEVKRDAHKHKKKG